MTTTPHASHVQVMFVDGAAADAAAEYYARVVPGAAAEPGVAEVPGRWLQLPGGLRIHLFDSPVPHAFGITPAVSLCLDLADMGDVDAAFAALADGGEVLMPLDEYPFSPRYGWCRDRWGVSWQVALART